MMKYLLLLTNTFYVPGTIHLFAYKFISTPRHAKKTNLLICRFGYPLILDKTAILQPLTFENGVSPDTILE